MRGPAPGRLEAGARPECGDPAQATPRLRVMGLARSLLDPQGRWVQSFCRLKGPSGLQGAALSSPLARGVL